MSLLPHLPKPVNEAAIWQDVEFGSYSADLPLWTRLAREAGGAVVELGAGSGRVTLHLARAGYEVLAVERDRELASELERRARGHSIRVVTADIGLADPPWHRSVPPRTRLAIAPLQIFQLLEETERRNVIAAAAEVLPPGGRFAAALVDETTLVDGGVAAAPRPDMREVDGWVYYSEPLWVHVSARSLQMRRLRERVSPGGDLVRRVHDDQLHRLSPDHLEEEVRQAGLRPLERCSVRSGPSEAGSVVVQAEAP
jgi:SAM-dependent methyltransferase